MRMLMNNLDPDVAERPEDLVVYGGTGRAARSWEAFDAIVRTLRDLRDDETLLVQSGKPVAVFRTHDMAPRVLISNSMLVPKWADWDTFRALEAQGLTMYGQMTAGSWIYIGTQGILQGTYETLAECAHQHFGSSLAGTITLTGGLGGMGGAQPLAVTMNDGVALCVEVDPIRIERRIKTRYLDRETDDLDTALAWAEEAKAARAAVSIGLLGNCAEVLPELVRRGWRPDVVTDQTSAHDPLGGYVPAGLSPSDATALRTDDPDTYVHRAHASMAAHVEAMATFQDRGAITFDYGNNLRAGAELGGLDHDRAYAFPGFVPAFVRPLFCEGKGPFRWAALSGDPADILATDQAVAELFPENERLQRWIRMAEERVAYQGLPARICWLGYGERDRAGERFNEMVASGAVSAPDRDRARSPGQRERREPLPRDRVDAGRLRRDRRLAHPERVGQHRERRALGERAPRRGRRDRLLDPRRDGRGGRRNGERAGAPGAGARERPRHGRGPPRGCRVRRARSRSPRTAGCGSRCGRRSEPGAPHRRDGRRGLHDGRSGAGPLCPGPRGRRPTEGVLPAARDGRRSPCTSCGSSTRSPPAGSSRRTSTCSTARSRTSRAFLAEQDLIYVGGGNTANLLAIWRVHGVDAALRAAWESGVVCCGMSAGANCWFEASTTDSFLLGQADPLRDGLGLLPGSFTPHYDAEEARRPSLRALVGSGAFPEGLACDDFAAVHFVGTEPVEAVASRAGAQAYRVTRGDGVAVEEPLEVRALT